MEMKVTYDEEKKLGSMKHSNIREKFYWESRREELPKCVLSYD